MQTFAEVKWTAGDVLTLRPRWTDEQARNWLEKNEKYLCDAMIERGWQAMEDLLPPEISHLPDD